MSSWAGSLQLQARILGREVAAVSVPPAVLAALTGFNQLAGLLPAQQQQRRQRLEQQQQQQPAPLTVAALVGDRPAQADLLELCDLSVAARLLADAAPRDRARLLAVGMPHAGAFLTAVPTWHNKIVSREFGMACRFRLGLPVYQAGLRACPACRTSIDQFGHHSIICASTGDRIRRHDHQRDTWAKSGESAQLGVTVEYGPEETRHRPADVLFDGWHDHREAGFDFVVTSPLAESYYAGASRRRGCTAAAAERSKEATSGRRCREEGVEFTPMAVEAMGGWGKRAMCAFSELSARVAVQSGRRQSDELRWMYERHSVALQRDNARMILRRCAVYSPP